MDPKLLEQMDRELEPDGRHDSPTGLLYHYTDAAGFAGIVHDRVVWATHYRHLNDREELVIGERVVTEVAEEVVGRSEQETISVDLMRRFAEAHSKASLTQITDVYVASFSEANDMLSQWRA